VNFYNNELTLADIYAYTSLSLFRHTQPEAYKPFAASFDAFLGHFEAIPSIKAYQASTRYPRLPPVPAA
jgi:glutathione S-transferase